MFAYPSSRLTDAVLAQGGRARRITWDECALSTPSGQKYLVDLVYELRPKHIFMAPECKAWGNWSRFHMTRSTTALETITQARFPQKTVLHLCNRLRKIKVQARRHFHLEQPAGSSMLSQDSLRRVIRATHPVLLDMCRLNLRLPDPNRLIRKRTVLRSTLPELVHKLDGTLCRKNHAHQHVAGSARVNGGTISFSRFAASYSAGFA